MKTKVAEFIVTVEPVNRLGFFPVDMLRYDGLSPNSETDSGRIERSIRGDDRISERVELRRWGSTSWWPCTQRWESFNWRVVDVRMTGRVL